MAATSAYTASLDYVQTPDGFDEPLSSVLCWREVWRHWCAQSETRREGVELRLSPVCLAPFQVHLEKLLRLTYKMTLPAISRRCLFTGATKAVRIPCF